MIHQKDAEGEKIKGNMRKIKEDKRRMFCRFIYCYCLLSSVAQAT